MHARTSDHLFLRRAARLAIRGHGGAEPNPMVGCVIVGAGGAVVGEGYHRRCGGPHAEVNALLAAGAAARGATAYVTLEPCNHHGRTGPCSEALIDAGVAEVVFTRPDESEHGKGGGRRLQQAGVAVRQVEDALATVVSTPFYRRLATGRPWVIAKWAQTVDGRIATAAGASQWISGPRSRAMVHRERGRVDVILTGIGTVLADDPALTARCRRPRRHPRRVVVDPKLQIPLNAKLVTDGAAPTTIAAHESLIAAGGEKVAALEQRGVELLPLPMDGRDLPMEGLLTELSRRHQASTVWVEAGGGLVGRLFRQGLIDEAWVFTGPLLLGDVSAAPCVRGMAAQSLTDGIDLELLGVHRRGDDVLARYLVR